MKKTIITVVGKDRVGIIAKVCVYLAENNINILDIAQTIVDGYFNMMMVVNAEAASILIPVFVEPVLTEEQTFPVTANAFGIERIKSSSAFVILFETRAEYPPIKLTPTLSAARSSVFAISTKSSLVLHTLPPTSAIGVTDIRLFTIGIPYFLEISSPV